MQEAKEIARRLVEQRLAACVGLIPQESIYLWQGEITEETEYLLTIKTTRECFASLKETILSMHSYEVPEIIGISIDEGHKPYLDWIGKCVSQGCT